MRPLLPFPRPLALAALATGLVLSACADVAPDLTGPSTEAPRDAIRAPTGLAAPFPMRSASSWSATVDITVHDADHNPINGATVVGRWSRSGLNSNTCTTGDGGGVGTCVVLFPSLPLSAAQVRFTVSSVTRNGNTYQSGANHDPDGESTGTYIIVRRP